MFTGIIEEVGAVKQITHGQHSEVLNIQARTVLENTKIGDSIAVNGICLTVTRLFADSFSADVMHETLNRSSLAGLMVGSRVNLERAMAADGRFGGHIVAGHVDGTGCILRIEKDDNACPLFTSPSPRDGHLYRMPSSAGKKKGGIDILLTATTTEQKTARQFT